MPENTNDLAVKIIANADDLVAATRLAQKELEKTGLSSVEAGRVIDRVFAEMPISAEVAARHISEAYGRTVTSAEAAATAQIGASERVAAATQQTTASQISAAEKASAAQIAAAERAAAAQIASVERAQGVRLSVIQAAMAKEKAAFEEASALQSALAGRGTTLNPNQKLAFNERMAAAKTAAAEEIAANKAVADAFQRDMKAAHASLMVPGLGTVKEEEQRARQGTGGARMASVLTGGANFAANMAAGITGIGFSAAKMAADYETHMLTVKNNTMMSSKEFEEMKRVVNDLGTASGAPLEKLAEGFRHISDFGFHGSDATKVLTASMKAAVSTGADVGETAQLTAKVLREYGMAADQASTVTNKLWYASANSDQTFKDLITTGRQALAMGANLGVNFNQMAAGLSVFTHQGLNASQSATQLINVMNKITTPTAGVRKELEMISQTTRKTIGVDLVQDFTAAGLKTKQFSGIFADVRAAAEQMGIPVDRLAHDLFPNLRGTIGALIGTSTEGFKGLETRLKAMDGIAIKNPIEAGYQERLQTANQQWAKLANTIKVDFLPIGKDVLKSLTDMIPDLTKMADGLAKALGWFTKLPAPIKDVTYGIGALQLATMALGGPLGLGGLFKKFAELIKYLTVGIPSAAAVSEGALAGVAAAGAGEAAAGGVKGGFLLQAGKWAARAAAANPVGAGILAAGAATYGGLKLWERNSDQNIAANERPLDMGTIWGLRRGAKPYRDTPDYNRPMGLRAERADLSPAEAGRASTISRRLFGQPNLALDTPKQWDQIAGTISAATHADEVRRRRLGKQERTSSGRGSYREFAAAEARRQGVDPGLMVALLQHESGFNPRARSPVGALGIGQLMPGTARGLGVNPMDPYDNIRGAVRYFQAQMNRFHDPRLALAAYNAGPGAVQKYGGVPPYRETQNYVRSIMAASGKRIPGVGGYSPPVEKSASERAFDAQLAAAKGGSKLTEAQREQKAALKELSGLHAAARAAIVPHTAAESEHAKIVAAVAKQYPQLSSGLRTQIVTAREAAAEQTKLSNALIADQRKKAAGEASFRAELNQTNAAIRALKAGKDETAEKKTFYGVSAGQTKALEQAVQYRKHLEDVKSAQASFNEKLAEAKGRVADLLTGEGIAKLRAVFHNLIPDDQLQNLQQFNEQGKNLADLLANQARGRDYLTELQAGFADMQARRLGITGTEKEKTKLEGFGLNDTQVAEGLRLYTSTQSGNAVQDQIDRARQKLAELKAEYTTLTTGDKAESVAAQYKGLLPADMVKTLTAQTQLNEAAKEKKKADDASLATTDRLKEALADSQVKTDKARGSTDFYAAALARLNLVTKQLTPDQQALVSQIAGVDKQAAQIAAHTRLMQNASRTIEGIFANSFDAMFKKGGNFFRSLGDGFKNLAQKIVVDWAASKVTGFLTPLLDKGLGLLGIGGKQKSITGNTAAPIEQASLQAGGAITSGGAVLQRALLSVAAGIGGPRLALAGAGATLPGIGLNLGMGGGGNLFPGLTLPSLTQGYTPGFNPAVANPIDQAGKATAASIQTTGNAVSNSLFGLVGIFQQHGSHLSQVLSALAMVFSSMKGGTMGGLGSIFGGLSGLFSKGKGGGGLLGKIFGGASFVKGISSLFAPKKKKKHGLFGGILGGIGSIFGKLGGGIFGKLLTGIGGGFPGILMSLLGGGEDGPLGDFLPMFGNGGFPSVDMPSIVGEKGPELFIPQNRGRIISNSDLNLALQRGGNTSHSTLNAPITVTVHNTVHGGLHTQMDTKAMSDNLSEQILREVRSGLRKPQRF